CQTPESEKIDRKAVVQRQNIVNQSADTLASLTVGNGVFAYTVDVRGMQSFSVCYKEGVSLGTQSERGWNALDNDENYRLEETLKSYDFNNEGRDAKYSIQHKEGGRNTEATEYYLVNPHRLQLGNVGLQFTLKSGEQATVDDIQQAEQTLDLWTGLIHSKFTIEGEPVEVWTAAAQSVDKIAVKVSSPLIADERLQVFVRYPFPSGQFLDEAAYY